MKDSVGVMTLAASNIGAAVVKVSWVAAAAPYLQFIIGLGQVAVAVVTVWYIWTKIKKLKQKVKDKDEG